MPRRKKINQRTKKIQLTNALIDFFLTCELPLDEDDSDDILGLYFFRPEQDVKKVWNDCRDYILKIAEDRSINEVHGLTYD